MKKLKKLIKYLWHELKNWHTLLLFGIVCAVVGVEVWLPLVLGIIFHNGWLISIAVTCEMFWLAPFTPFLPLCIAITLGLKALWRNTKNKPMLFVSLALLVLGAAIEVISIKLFEYFEFSYLVIIFGLMFIGSCLLIYESSKLLIRSIIGCEED